MEPQSIAEQNTRLRVVSDEQKPFPLPGKTYRSTGSSKDVAKRPRGPQIRTVGIRLIGFSHSIGDKVCADRFRGRRPAAISSIEVSRISLKNRWTPVDF